MLMDTGGNCGSQSSTLIIRGIALNQVTFHDFFRVIWKEFRVSLIVGVVLAVANGLRIYLTYQQAGMAIVIALSLVATVISADHYHRRCEFHYDLLRYRNESISPVGIKNITKSITVTIAFFLHFSKILVFIWIYSYNIITYDIFSYCRQRPAVSVSITCRKELQV